MIELFIEKVIANRANIQNLNEIDFRAKLKLLFVEAVNESQVASTVEKIEKAPEPVAPTQETPAPEPVASSPVEPVQEQVAE